MWSETVTVDGSNTAILVAVVGLVSAVIGGLIQSFSTLSFERLKFERQSKWELYSSYFVALGELGFSDERSERHINALSFMAQIRGKIGIVGSPAVIRAVGDVFKFGNFGTVQAQMAMAKALEEMRRDVGARKAEIDHRDLVQLMFDSRISEK
jgi:hypothetical protein